MDGHLDIAADPPRDLALFDFDGTITTRETFVDFLRLALPAWRRMLGQLVLAPVVVGYKLGLVPVAPLRAIIAAYGFAGASAARVDAAGVRFSRDVVPALVRPEALARIHWHQARGDKVVVVSGAFDLAIAPWCAAHGVDLIASSLAVRRGRLTGRYDGAQCVADEKVSRVRARYDLTAFAAVHAYGDTPEDIALLALADHATYRWAPWREDVSASPCRKKTMAMQARDA